ncbi:uncharacterized protein K452DRAFT_228115 [Aplosporella prunicola CBS 121167]|uniref:Uncharacterized protein n=1 Tax=Aplosporella prunicola CBS 121167 TaxID=1176127 RepID=A0A6A6BC04_9PEZI|nr:uncharacterized protein K452DRAFT_228115 [Aplosporella prunicola CBS 121167]KAF2141650.1 hypothetical protein K452DRAFT_228115 [Aplosporella prunicola CBS 121167]
MPPSSTDFAPPPAPSPMHSYQSARMLPSPTSINFPSGSGLPSIASPAPSLQTSVQTTHLQELQHQVSVKTLALQTLQKEYDNLLQRLNRQHTKCAALERKFEVSDVEINTLTNDKEDLEARNASLEAQIEELQQSRDDARREVHANSAQYMKILEMASRLQAQSSEDKRKWAKEKAELEAAVEAAGKGVVSDIERPRPTAARLEEIISPSPGPSSNAAAWHADPLCRPEPQIIAALRVEVAQLRSRTHSLEEAVRSMRDEGSKMAEVARMIADAGSKMGESARKAFGER